MNDLKKAAQQALEALEKTHTQPGCEQWQAERKASVALRAALTQQEQATVKESLPVGQEEPEGGWQSAPSPQVTQRIADMPMSEYRRGVNDGFKLGLREGRIKAEDEMREQQEQEPVAWTDRDLELIDGMIEVQLHHAAQCDGIANRTMAEKQKGWDMERVALLHKIKSNPPRREPEQGQAEPVLVVEKEPDYMSRGHFYEGSKPFIDPTLVWKLPIGTKLYTAPPRREWRGLTEKEIQSIHDTYHKRMGPQEFARAIEQALRSKNQ